MKKFRCVTVFVLGVFACLVLGINALYSTQHELTLLCDKFNEDITLPERLQCAEPVYMTKDGVTFIDQQNNIVTYEYTRLDPTNRIKAGTHVWFNFLSVKPGRRCDRPTELEKWRMSVWLTADEETCYYPYM